MPASLCECGCGEQTEVRNGKPNRFVFGHAVRTKKTPPFTSLCACGCGQMTRPRRVKTSQFIRGHKHSPRPAPQLCACGCGELTEIRRGKPNRFIEGHNSRGSENPHWRGGRHSDREYIGIWVPGHPRADTQGYVYEHILVAERALGKPIPPGAIVHHDDRNPGNNSNANLVICQDQAYHRLIHYRAKAYEECGNANWFRCRLCKQWDRPEALYVRSWTHASGGSRTLAYHRACSAEEARNRKRKRREQK